MFPRIKSRPVYGLGLDMSQLFLHLLEIKIQSETCFITNCACFDPSESIPESINLNSAECILALNDNDLVTKQLSIRSGLSELALEMLVWHEVQKYFSLPASELLIDYYTQSAQNSMIDLIILASRKQLLDEVRPLPLMSQLSIECIDLESYALARALMFIAKHDNLESFKSLVLVYFNNAHCQFILVHDDELQLVQNIHYENPQRLTDTLIDIFKLSKDRLNNIHCFLAGDFACFNDLVEPIQQKTSWSVSVANPLALFKSLNPLSDDFIKTRGPAFLLAFGLALRGNHYESY